MKPKKFNLQPKRLKLVPKKKKIKTSAENIKPRSKENKKWTDWDHCFVVNGMFAKWFSCGKPLGKHIY